MGRTPGGSPNVRVTVSRRSSTQDGLRSVPTRRVASPLLGFRLLKTPGHVALKSERENKMRWMIVGTMVAAGSLSATAVRAQESNAGSGAIATEHSAQSQPPAYGAYVSGPSTIDADGVPVAKPNPMSEFLDGAKDDPPVETPLVDAPPTDTSGTDAETH